MSLKKLLAYLLILAIILVFVWWIVSMFLATPGSPCDSRETHDYMKLVKHDQWGWTSYSIHYYDHVDQSILVIPQIPEFDIEIILTDLKSQGRITQTQWDCGIDQIR